MNFQNGFDTNLTHRLLSLSDLFNHSGKEFQ